MQEAATRARESNSSSLEGKVARGIAEVGEGRLRVILWPNQSYMASKSGVKWRETTLATAMRSGSSQQSRPEAETSSALQIAKLDS